MIHTDVDSVFSDLSSASHQVSKREHKLSVSILPFEGQEEMTTDDTLWSERVDLLDFLCYLPYPETCLQELVTVLEDYYHDEIAFRNKVKNFGKNYEARDAIQWYTEDSFVYRLINLASRQQNIKLLFLFGFIIKDIYQQLKREHKRFRTLQSRAGNSRIKAFTAFRGQLMSDKEIRQLKSDNSVPWVYCNSFLSTDFDANVAKEFLGAPIRASESDAGPYRVLFDIEVDTTTKSRPYADVSLISRFEGETEIIFPFGTRFEKTTMDYDEKEKIYKINLKLNYDYFMKDDALFVYESQRKTLKACMSLLNNATHDMPIKNISILFNELYNLYPFETEWISAFEKFCLADQYMKQEEYTKAISHFSEARDIWSKFINDEELNCYIDIGTIHQGLGKCHQFGMKNDSLAENEYLQAIEYFKMGLKKAKTSYERMKLYEKLSYLERDRIYLAGYDQTDMNLILRYETLCIASMRQYYSEDSVQLAYTLAQLAQVKRIQHEYDECLICLQDTLDILLKESLKYEIYLAICKVVDAFIEIYIEEKNQDYSNAIVYALFKHTLISAHFINVERFQGNIRYINQYDLALSHVDLAAMYLAMKELKLARMHTKLAVDIYKNCVDMSVGHYEDIKHSKFQEELSNLALEKQKYEQAYRFIKHSKQCLEQQQIILRTHMMTLSKTSLIYLHYNQQWEKLEARHKLLSEKQFKIKNLMTK